jgi:cytochrome c-type biogenesis protein CcmE
MTRKQQRLGLLALGLAGLAGATPLVLVAFNDNLVFFFSPSDLKTKAVAADRRVRIGGLVEAQSLSRAPDGRSVSFRLTDGSTDVAVVYQGLLPDLFREGQAPSPKESCARMVSLPPRVCSPNTMRITCLARLSTR